jgi:uncharacterized protein (UPF0261 family)
MSAYMDTAHYRVNRFAASVKVILPQREVIAAVVPGMELHTADLLAVVQEWAAMREALAGTDRFLLVIESAVRNADPANYEGVMAAMRAVRDIVKPPSSPTNSSAAP